MSKFKPLFGIYCILLLVNFFIDFFNNLGMVLVLHRRLPAWGGSRVFPLSRPPYYPAETSKSATTLGPHCGAFIWWL